MKNTTVQINDRAITVTKLSLKKLGPLIATLENIPAIIEEISNNNEGEIMKRIGQLVAKFTPDAIKIIQVSTDLSVEEIEEWGMVELLLVGQAIYEINDLNILIERFRSKKADAQPEAPVNESPESIPSTGSMAQ